MVWHVVFGAFGMGYAMYGHRQRHALALTCGVGLMGLPYVLTPVWLLVSICSGLIALPYFFRK